MFSISDKVFVSFKIDGEEIAGPNMFKQILLVEGNKNVLPVAQITLTDHQSLFSSPDKSITEGNLIEILVTRSPIDTRIPIRRYRAFCPRAEHNADGPTYIIPAIIDAYKFHTSSVVESFEGDSDSVLKKIADKCDMNYSGIKDSSGRSTNDAQVWLSVAKTRMALVQNIVRHSFLDQHSAMSHCVTSLNELRLRNLTDVMATPIDKIKYVFMHNTAPKSDSKKTWFVKESRETSDSSLMNSWLNYGSKRIRPSLTGTPDVFEKQKVKVPGKYLPINGDLKAEVETSRIEYAPIDCGNTHQYYDQAGYQNQKLLALFSEQLSILVEDVTEVQLYDPVIYRQSDSDIASPIRVSDVYMVVGKTIAIQNNQYAERIELARMSLTMKGSTELKAPADLNNTPSILPGPSIVDAGLATAKSNLNVKALSGAIGNVTAAAGKVEALKGQVAGSLAGLKDKAGGMVSALASGVETSIVAAAGPLSSALSVATSVMGTANGLISGCTAACTGLLDQAKSLVPASLVAVVSGKGSLLDSVTSQLGIAGSAHSANDLVKDIMKKIPKPLRKLGPLKELQAKADKFDAVINSNAAKITGQWNKVTSKLRGVEEKATDIIGKGAAVSSKLNSVLTTANATNDSLKKVVANAWSKDLNSTPNYLDGSVLTQRTQPYKDLGTSLSQLDNSIKRLDNA